VYRSVKAMNKYITILLLCLFSSVSYAHEMTPTYPELRQSYLDDLMVTEMELFNFRNDVEYYEIAVFDKDMKPIPFVSSYKVFKLEYLSRIKFEVYIRESDRYRVEYICSRSKARPNVLEERPTISSMICSKVKRE